MIDYERNIMPLFDILHVQILAWTDASIEEFFRLKIIALGFLMKLSFFGNEIIANNIPNKLHGKLRSNLIALVYQQKMFDGALGQSRNHFRDCLGI